MNQPETSPQGEELAREISVFLVQLSVALHKAGAYPPNHPVVREAVEAVYVQLLALQTERDVLAIGVASDQLIIDDMATDPKSSVLAELAKRLHRHQIGAVRLQAGTTLEELTDFLAIVCLEADREEIPFGLRSSEEMDRWQHIQVIPHTFESLVLAEDGTEGEGQGNQSQLWLGLAAAALSDDAGGGPRTSDVGPSQIAEAIKARRDDRSYDKVIVGYLTQAGRELKGREGTVARALQQQISGLVKSLDQDTLKRLLEVGGSPADRTKLLSDLSSTLPVDAVMDLVQAAADTGGQTISHSFLRMLSKMADHSDAGGRVALKPHAGENFRASVQALIADWNLEDPNPDAYTNVLEGLADYESDETLSTAVEKVSASPRIIQMAMEVGAFGATVAYATADMLHTGRFQELLEILDGAPEESGGRENIWSLLSSPEHVRYLLEHYEHNIEGVQRVLERLGPEDADQLLNALETASSRAMRHRLLSTMTAMGSDIGPMALARLAKSVWFVKRNLLILLGSLPEWPEGFSPEMYTRADDARVRREAVKLMLQVDDPETRDSAILIGVDDDDVSIVRMALTAAATACPPKAQLSVLQLVDNDDGDIRVLAIRVFGVMGTPRALSVLLDHALARRRWWQRRRRLADTSPEMLAALGALAKSWANSPEVQPVLESARKSSLEEVRAVVSNV